jgi:hypothetical protein
VFVDATNGIPSPKKNYLVRWCRSSRRKTKRRRCRWRTRRPTAYRPR